jgi:hypothetical protein
MNGNKGFKPALYRLLRDRNDVFHRLHYKDDLLLIFSMNFAVGGLPTYKALTMQGVVVEFEYYGTLYSAATPPITLFELVK